MLNKIYNKLFHTSDHVDYTHINEGILLFEDFFHGNYCMVTRNSTEYKARIFPKKRKFIAYSRHLCLWFTFIRFQLSFWVNDKWIQVLFTDPTYLFESGALVCLVISMVALL